MAKECFYGEQVSAVLIQMGAKSMAEGMAGEAVRPAEPALMLMDVTGEEEGIDGRIGTILFREEPIHGPATGEPVLSEQIKCGFREYGIAVLSVFGMADVDTHIFTFNIVVAQVADFTDAQAGRIHEGDHGLLLEIRDGGDEMPGIFL